MYPQSKNKSFMRRLGRFFHRISRGASRSASDHLPGEMRGVGAFGITARQVALGEERDEVHLEHAENPTVNDGQNRAA